MLEKLPHEPQDMPCRETTPLVEKASNAIISRRSLLVALGGALLSLAFPEHAHAYTKYATTNMGSIWNPPNYVRLNQDSNLFLPGDIPRNGCRATCTFTNRAISLDTSYSYWGTDNGLSYTNSNQIHWPLRNYSYGQDAFNYDAVVAGSWRDTTIDSFTNASLENNSSGCGRSGYEAHQIVSFSIWDVSGFGGGVMPTQVGAWAMHNASGHIKGTYGYYTGGGNEGGVTPPDWFCCVPGYGANAHVTCFSVKALASGENYVLLYCLYVLISLADEAAQWGASWDNYGGISWASALAARLKCVIDVTGLDDVANVLASNVCRLMRCESSVETAQETLREALEGSTSLPEALEKAFADYSYDNIFLTSRDAADQLCRALLQGEPGAEDLDRVASAIDSGSLGSAIRQELETRETDGTLSFPVRVPAMACKVNERDAGNNLRTITTGSSGEGHTGYVFNRGIYTAKMQSAPSGWTLSTISDKVTIPDTGSGQAFSFRYAMEASVPETVDAEPYVRYYRDYEAMRALGKSALCYAEKGIRGSVYHARDKETANASRASCSWDGWYVDPACTAPYEEGVLEGDLELYCVNRAAIRWEKSQRTKDLEAGQGSRLCSDQELETPVSIDDILPEPTTVTWHEAYSLPELPRLFWQSSGETRSSDGRCCRDSAGKYAVSGQVAITRNTTFYADWRPATYDGIRSS